MTEEKQCIACGELFMPRKKGQKICDECIRENKELEEDLPIPGIDYKKE